MDVYNSEEQQVEAIKSWWQENGKSIIAGVVIGFIGLFGWRFYNDHIRQKNEAAAAEYQTMMQSLGEKHDKAFDAVAQFADSHKDTYGDLARLQLASDAVKAGKLDLAAAQLRKVSEQAQDETFKPVAAIRLARVLTAQNKFVEALKVLNSVADEQYKAAVAEAKGDALLASAQPEKAREAYNAAIQAGKNGANPVLQMKLDDLAVAGNKTEVPAAK